MQMDLLTAYGWQGLVLASWIGLCVGSFLNVVIYRLPVMLDREWQSQARDILQLTDPASDTPGAEPEPFNLSVPRSRCPHCGHAIRWFENIPVISWLALRARCAGCGAAISARYPAIELLTAVLTLMVVATFGFTWFGLGAAVLTWYLVAMTFIDYDTQLLPDQLTVPLMWFGLAFAALSPGYVQLYDAVIGAMAGYLFLWSVYWAFKLLRGKEGMGYGDFKLLAALGAWLGWQALPSIILVSAVLGLAYALTRMLLGKQNSDQPIPFGPFLAGAGWVTLIFRDTVISLFQL